MLFLIIVPYITGFVLAGFGAWALKKSQWSNKKQKWVFICAATLCLHTMFAPISIMTALPTPAIMLWILCLVDGEISGLFMIYTQMWMIIIPSLIINFLLFWGIANMVFFIPPNHKNKSVPTP